MKTKLILKDAQETANMLFKKNKGKNSEAASYYRGRWEALVWVQYDIDGDLFEEWELNG